MKNFEIQVGLLPYLNDLIYLHKDCKRLELLEDYEKLKRIYEKSFNVISAWYEEKLVGIVRLIGDGESIIYIEDIMVLKKFRRQKIGTYLIKTVLDKYKNVDKIVLVCSEEDYLKNFFQKNGFEKINLYGLNCFSKHKDKILL